MNDEVTEKQKSNLENNDLGTEKDWFLQSLVNTANKNYGKSFTGITLVSHGFLVSGLLTSGRDYFDNISDEFTDSSSDKDDESTRNMKKSFSDMGNKLYDKAEKEDNPAKTSYIHLKDAKIFHPTGNPIPGNKGLWWRGRLSEISGFSIGILSKQEPQF